MCILFLKYSPDEGDYVLIAANNRDEIFDRPTSPAAFWSDHPKLLAGRDLLAPNGGTWFGVTTDGRFSVLTNFRVPPKDIDPNAQSRGHLVSDYLTGTTSPLDYCQSIDGSKFNGYLLLAADLRGEPSLVYTSNYDPSTPRQLDPGIHGLSNSVLDCPWQKVQKGKEKFSDIVSSPDSTLTDQLFQLLSDDTSYWPDPTIPDTSYSEERYKNTSAVFVNPCDTPRGLYGTRIQTVLLVSRHGNVSYTERTLSPKTSEWSTVTHTFQLDIS